MRTGRLVFAVLVIGCGGGGAGGPGGAGGSGGIGGSSGQGGAGGGKVDAATAGGGARGPDAATAIDAGSAGDAGPPQMKKLVGGRARLVGGPGTACSQPPGKSDRWCAFTLPATMPLGATELWAINVDRAIPGDVACDGKSPACVKLTSTLWTGTPSAGVVHPLAHHFDGETLIFYANTPVTTQAFSGSIFAWRPGWPQAKQLSGPNGYSCEGDGHADAALCIEDVHLEATPPYFDVHAGRVNGSPLPLASRIYPSSPAGARQWSIAFTPAGDYFAYSTGGATAAEPETLYAWKIDEVGMADRRVTVGAVASWDIASDGKHWFYLRDYNYPPRNSTLDPSGTLVSADFPGGGNPVTVATQVGSYVLLGEIGTARGVAYLDHLTAGKGTYKMLSDPTKPAGAVTVATNVLSALVSPDLRYSLLQTQTGATSADVGDAVIIKNDGTGRCALAAGATAAQFGAAFLPHSDRVFWADNVNPMTLEGEGWIGNPDGCGDKQKFGSLVDFWFLAGDAGLVFSDTATTSTSTVRYAKLGAGGAFPAGGATLIRAGVGRVYAPLGPDLDHIIFQIGDGGPDDGIYVYGPIGF
jgi:hypothetical protein